MNNRIAVLALAVISSQAMAATGFTYQGQLISSGAPATGGFDFQFTLYTAATAGTVVGTQVTATNVTVTAGLFSTTLDFGAAAFDGADRWVEISVRPTATMPYTVLAPRQAITPTPYALTGLNNVLRAGDSMTGPLTLPSGGLAVGTNQLVVSPLGYVGVGTATPNYGLDVQGNGFAGISMHDTNSMYSFSQGANGDDWFFGVNTSNGSRTLMHFNGAGTVLTQNATVSIAYGLSVRYQRVTNTTTLDEEQHVVLIDSTSAAVTVTLPAANLMQGRMLILKHAGGANAVSIVGSPASATIDGVVGLSLTTANATRTLICDGSKWLVIAN